MKRLWSLVCFADAHALSMLRIDAPAQMLNVLWPTFAPAPPTQAGAVPRHPRCSRQGRCLGPRPALQRDMVAGPLAVVRHHVRRHGSRLYALAGRPCVRSRTLHHT